MRKWVRTEEGLPPLDLPVWMFLADTGQIVIGCRSEAEEGWLWGECYDGDYWWDNEKRIWKADNCEQDDDYQPTHWQYLPQPPVMETK
jgi:hypothetical protein